MVEPQAFRNSRLQMFYKIDVLENFAKFCKMLESLFNKVAHMLSYELCKIFKNAYFPITPQNLSK